ncbi:hypothetical protein [Terracidiphilus gabretensis]|uniref:hypothetical protein n=1 Tax=Terracidiphilus gabretensis TaxID=1577687 RepID=UPI00071BD33B|nr:hypothetical protein [Terracidiphilus gabretensis]
MTDMRFVLPCRRYLFRGMAQSYERAVLLVEEEAIIALPISFAFIQPSLSHTSYRDPTNGEVKHAT